MKTAEDLQRAANIGRRALTRYQQAGLIPEPQLIPGPSGLGRRGAWADEVESRVVQIADLQRRGVSLEDIEKSLRLTGQVTWGQPGERAKALRKLLDEGRKHIRLPVLNGAPEQEVVYSGWALVRHELEDEFGRHLGFSKKRVRELVNATVSDNIMGWALELYSWGFCPVLVLPRGSSKEMFVTTDFLLAHEVNALTQEHVTSQTIGALVEARDQARRDAQMRARPAWHASIIVPLWPVIAMSLAHCNLKTDLPNVTAGFRILMIEDKAIMERAFTLQPLPQAAGHGRFGFNVQARFERTALLKEEGERLVEEAREQDERDNSGADKP